MAGFLIKKLLLYIYSTCKLIIRPKYTYWHREYFAYNTKKLMWNHALQITYRLFFVCLAYAYSSILVLVYTVITEWYSIRGLYTVIEWLNLFIKRIFRTLYIYFAIIYTKFADNDPEYQYSFYAYVCLWVLVGFTIKLLFLS